MKLVLDELSRVMAGDRWLVELLCQAHIPIDETFWAVVPPEDVQLLPRIREMLGEKLVFAAVKNVTLSMQKSGKKCFMKWSSRYMIPYWDTWTDPHFSLKLFKKQYKECSKQVLIQAAMNPAESSLSEE